MTVAEGRGLGEVTRAIDASVSHLRGIQHADGYWWGELESNVTITAEVVMLRSIWGTLDRLPVAKIEKYFRREQRAHGGWELYFDDGGELSTTIEAYFAMRLLGVAGDDPAMCRAREFILNRGGVSRARIFTKFHLALFGAYDWVGLPSLPPWIMFLPPRGPFSIYDLSSWARGSTVPLVIVFDKKPVYERNVDVDELYPEGRANATHELPATASMIGRIFTLLDKGLKWLEGNGIRPLHDLALSAAKRWVLERQEATGDWGGIIPAMLNSMLSLRALGYDLRDSCVARGFAAIDAFGIEEDDVYRMQPCVSPVWDTALVARALADADVPGNDPALIRAGEWLMREQILDVRGDWSVKNPNAEPGGWAFEFDNRYYPDVDDTAVVVMALEDIALPDDARKRRAMERAARWIDSMQCKPGGWAAFDVDNDKAWLNHHPYADLHAMIDPNTVDVTARVVEMHARCGTGLDRGRVDRGIAFIDVEQEPDGAWFGRWGVNYVYGTCGALVALALHDPAGQREQLQRGAAWLLETQNPDGGWGETCGSYNDPTLRGRGPSTPSQTAWALIGLIAVAEVERTGTSPAIERGIAYLIAEQRPDGSWNDIHFTGTGFPSHFYLKYHLYADHFSLTALGRYRRLIAA